jgi:hypothetical protein
VGVLQRFERRLGGLVEGAFARVFKGGVEPVELASALTRECDDRKTRSAKRTLVPNDFVIMLSPPDYERLAPYRHALGDELASLVREHASAQRYTFIAPVSVSLELDEMLTVGRYEIHSEVSGEAVVGASGSTAASSRWRTEASQPPPYVQEPRPPAPPVGIPNPMADPAINPVPIGGAADRPTNPAQPPPQQPQALPRLIVSVGGSAANGTPASRGRELDVTLRRPVTVIGRGSDVDLQLADTGISRRHGELLLQPDGAHHYRDLGSTNGSRVNGRKVHEVPLVDGDRIEVGRSVLVYRHPQTGRTVGRQGGELSGHPHEA